MNTSEIPKNQDNEFARRIYQTTGIDPNSSIRDPFLRDTITRIGNVASMGMVRGDVLRDEFLRLNNAQAERQKSNSPGYQPNELNPIMYTLSTWFHELETTSNQNDPLRQIAENQKLATEAELKELVAGQVDFFLSIFFQRAASRGLGKESWYGPLSEGEKILLSLQNKFLFAFNGIDMSPGKRAGPFKGFEVYQGYLQIREVELTSLFNSVGFNIAFGTIVHDLFEYAELNPNIEIKKNTGDEGPPTAVATGEVKIKGMVFKRKNEAGEIDVEELLNNQIKFNAYRDSTIKKIEGFLDNHKELIEFGLSKNPSIFKEMNFSQARVAAEAYFGMAWNFLAIGNVPESGDIKRLIKTSDPTIYVPSWRNTIHPHDQAVAKWYRNEPELIGTEENLFGRVGLWFQERIRHDKKFTENFLKYKPGYRMYPRVTVGSLFDHTFFSTGQSLSEVFCDDRNRVNLGPGVNLYKFAGESINFRSLRDADPGSSYTDILDSVIKMSALITSPEPSKDPETDFSTFIGSISALQGKAVKRGQVADPILTAIYDPSQVEDLVVAAIGSIAGGFMQYSTELILKVDNYDGLVNSLLAQDKLYKLFGANIGDTEISKIRTRLLNRLNAQDTSTRFGSQRVTEERAGRGKRSNLIAKAAEENKKWIKKKSSLNPIKRLRRLLGGRRNS